MTRSRFAPLALILLAVPALAASVPEPDGYRMDHYRAPVPSTLHGAQVVDSATLARMLPQHPVLIDVLPAPRAAARLTPRPAAPPAAASRPRWQPLAPGCRPRRPGPSHGRLVPHPRHAGHARQP